ncbi:MAG: dTDP-glucose pyrophosphorylase, partial [Gemmatimonadales bacterium]|nr:dTDP-glucose pyrophosphorylase [Gemmatimonadales bacterium]
MEVVGLVPAAGWAHRISPLPCSKEIFPVGFWTPKGGDGPRPKAAAHHLLEKMSRAGARKAVVVLRDGKWDIPGYFGGGEFLGMHLAYVMNRRPYGVPFTLDDAYPFYENSLVVFGFPDIVFKPDVTFEKLLEKRQASGAELVLGIFPADCPQKMDMVRLDSQGRITEIDIKPRETDLRYTWLAAAWGPELSEFMHAFVEKAAPEVAAAGGKWRGAEMYVGDVLREAIEAGMHVETVVFEDGRYAD